MYKRYLALNNLQWLICHKTKANKTCTKDFSKVLGHIWTYTLYVYLCISLLFFYSFYQYSGNKIFAQSAGALEYTDCFSTEVWDTQQMS